MVGIIYFIVILGATLIGAIAGIGGGIIIKPVLDSMGIHNIETIAFLSCCAVLSMSLYSTIKHIRNKTEFNFEIVLFTSIGSIIGGLVGSRLFHNLLSLYPNNIVQGVQSILLLLLLLLVLLNMIFKFKTYDVKKRSIVILIGCGLGIISSFLGIGGGPANVAVFLLFFSCSLKQAVIYSIATIVFTQLSTLGTIATTSGFNDFDMSLLWLIIPAAILGGMIGTKINNHINENIIYYIFNITICVIMTLSLCNTIRAFF